MDTVLSEGFSTPKPVGRVLWFGDKDRLFGVDEVGEVFRFVRPVPPARVTLVRRVAAWLGGVR